MLPPSPWLILSVLLVIEDATVSIAPGERVLIVGEQVYLGHKNIQHTVRYAELSPDRFRNFWR
jgi:hypothetical protein